MDQGSDRRALGRWPSWLRAISVAGWVGVCAAGLGGLAEAASVAGAPAARAPRRWPVDSRISRAPGRTTLLMFAHSKCACTRASLRELERILARSGKRFDAHVFFSGPRDDGFLSLRAIATGIAGLAVHDDEAETLRFGALTSGQVLVYDRRGELLFRGGITSSRGHEGESFGNRAVLSLAIDDSHASDGKAQSSDVFGCALFRDQGNP